MKSIFITGLVTIAIVAGSMFVMRQQSNRSGITIGILQTASHPALDAARKGFEDELKKHLGNRVHFITKNAQGSIANAHIIAQLFANNTNLDGILAIATPAAQALAHVEHTKPIFITAVTDPVSLGLLGPNSNVCGSSDMVNSASTAKLATALVPQAKTAAIVFSISETSSVFIARELHVQLVKHGLQVVDIGIAQETDLPAAINRACTHADFIVTPLDNIVACAITFIANQTQRAKKPLIVSDNLLVAKGALAAAGIDYICAGKQAAQCALQVLTKNKKPAAIPLMHQPGSIVINNRVLNQIGLSMPKNLREQATFITGEQPCC